jgi:hypothetical protein
LAESSAPLIEHMEIINSAPIVTARDRMHLLMVRQAIIYRAFGLHSSSPAALEQPGCFTRTCIISWTNHAITLFTLARAGIHVLSFWYAS